MVFPCRFSGRSGTIAVLALCLVALERAARAGLYRSGRRRRGDHRGAGVLGAIGLALIAPSTIRSNACCGRRKAPARRMGRPARDDVLASGGGTLRGAGRGGSAPADHRRRAAGGPHRAARARILRAPGVSDHWKEKAPPIPGGSWAHPRPSAMLLVLAAAVALVALGGPDRAGLRRLRHGLAGHPRHPGPGQRLWPAAGPAARTSPCP